MKKKLCISMLLWYIGSNTPVYAALLPLVTQLFGAAGAQLSPDNLKIINDNLQCIEQASEYQLIQAAQLVTASLHDQLDKTNHQISTLQKNKELVPRTLFFKQILLSDQIKSMEQFIEDHTPNISYTQMVSHHLKELYRTLRQHISGATQQEPTALLGHALLSFIEIEREYILYNYAKLLTYSLGLNNYELPKIIDFWRDPLVRKKIQIRSKRLNLSITPAFFSSIIANIGLDMALQGVIFAGGALAINWVDQDDQEKFALLSKQSETISTAWQLFSTKLKQEQQDAIGTIINSFQEAQKNLQDQYAVTDQQLQQEVLYLNRSISSVIPQERFLINPILIDQYFSASTMMTPDNKYPWYNLFGWNGNWGYNYQTNSFWQYGLQPFGTPDWTSPNPGPAENSIFCEYVTGKRSYTIEVECCVIAADYPFFMGIMFNRTHFISGDPERMRGYRLIGLYGTQTDPNTPQTRSIGLHFAQQKITDASGQSGASTIISPLEQITTDQTTQLKNQDGSAIVLPAQQVQELGRNPLRYRFRIKTEAQQVTCSVFQISTDQNNTATDVLLGTQTIANLDHYPSLYHGIGFMAPGCKAEFKLISPEAITYTADQIQQYRSVLSKKLGIPNV